MSQILVDVWIASLALHGAPYYWNSQTWWSTKLGRRIDLDPAEFQLPNQHPLREIMCDLLMLVRFHEEKVRFEIYLEERVGAFLAL